jgi:hypothetical protein
VEAAVGQRALLSLLLPLLLVAATSCDPGRVLVLQNDSGKVMTLLVEGSTLTHELQPSQEMTVASSIQPGESRFTAELDGGSIGFVIDTGRIDQYKGTDGRYRLPLSHFVSMPAD